MVALETVELFRALKPEDVLALQAAAVECRFVPGEIIFKEGDSGDGMYVIREGSVEISGNLNPQTRRVYSRLGPGELFGEMAVIEPQPRSASACAAQPTAAYFLPREEMLALMHRAPELSLAMLQMVSRRLRDFNQQHLREVLESERLAVVGRFARAIIHDLKNPLNIIGLTCDAMSLPNATDDYRIKSQARIRKQVQRINDLVSELLVFSQGPERNLIVARLNFAVAMQRFIADIEPEIAARGCTLRVANEPPAVRVMLDTKRILRVLLNLVHNATDVMRSGGVVTLRFLLEENAVVTECADAGPGIAPEIADRLFDAFVTHGKEHGTGLGLSICKKIIEDHGGRIWARNEPGAGAVFAFSLPLAK
jgi:signal transduction histidine kinase